MKNFLLADSSELMAVRLISASWEKKRLIPTFLTWYTSSWRKIFFSPIRANFSLLDSFRPSWAQRRLIPTFGRRCTSSAWKIFFLADSSELLAVRLISASWAQRGLIPTFGTRCTSCAWKIFFSPIRTSSWLLDSFRPPEPKNLWCLLFWHDVRRVDEKFSSRRFERADGLIDSFRPPEPKKRLIPTF